MGGRHRPVAPTRSVTTVPSPRAARRPPVGSSTPSTPWSVGSGTPYRTLVCYKETNANQPIDPSDPPTWTGTWRDPRFSPPADGGYPENALTGTLFAVNSTRNDAIQVPAAYGNLRFWRNTA